jgi:hypothetical protein
MSRWLAISALILTANVFASNQSTRKSRTTSASLALILSHQTRPKVWDNGTNKDNL